MQAIEVCLRASCPALESLAAQAAQYLEAARASSTRKSYAADIRDFEAFCTAYGPPFLPSTPETVALYLTHLASRAAVSTCRRRLAAITYVHRQKGLDSPATPRKHFVLREVLAGITRTIGVCEHGARPILADAIRQIIGACPESLLGARDRALLLLGFAAGARANELVSILEVRDLTFANPGLYIRLRWSKNDQQRAGRSRVPPGGTSRRAFWLRAALRPRTSRSARSHTQASLPAFARPRPVPTGRALCHREQIEFWFARYGEDANWLLETGEESGVVSLQIDLRLARQSLAYLAGDDPAWQRGLRFTAGRRWHVLFEYASGLPQFRGYPGLFLHAGDSILVPPSRTPSGIELVYADPHAPLLSADWLRRAGKT
jgi:integrase